MFALVFLSHVRGEKNLVQLERHSKSTDLHQGQHALSRNVKGREKSNPLMWIRSKMEWVFPWPKLYSFTKFHGNRPVFA